MRTEMRRRLSSSAVLALLVSTGVGVASAEASASTPGVRGASLLTLPATPNSVKPSRVLVTVDAGVAPASLAVFGEAQALRAALKTAGVKRVVAYDFSAEMALLRKQATVRDIVTAAAARRPAVGSGALLDTSRVPAVAVVSASERVARSIRNARTDLASKLLAVRGGSGGQCRQAGHASLGPDFLGQIEATELYTEGSGCRSAYTVDAALPPVPKPPHIYLDPPPVPKPPHIYLDPPPVPTPPHIHLDPVPTVPPMSLQADPDIPDPAAPLIDPDTDTSDGLPCAVGATLDASCGNRQKHSEGKYFMYYEDPPGKTVARTYVHVDYRFYKGPSCVMAPVNASWDDYWLSETGWHEDTESDSFSWPWNCQAVTASRYVRFWNDAFCKVAQRNPLVPTTRVFFDKAVLIGRANGTLDGKDSHAHKKGGCAELLHFNERMVRTAPFDRCTGDDCEKYGVPTPARREG
jgi:hypothetical protein